MKKWLTLVLCFVMLLGLLACGETQQEENKGFQVGFSRGDGERFAQYYVDTLNEMHKG